MIEQGAAGLFLDPGLGKTSIALAAYKMLKAKGMVKAMLVIAPLRAIYNVWPQEITKWDAFTGLRCALLHGPGKLAVLARSDVDVYCINPEGVSWLSQTLAKIPKSKWPFDFLVVDESTKFKTHNSQRFKALKPLLNNFKRRYILTGTPTPNGLMDLFGQVYILDQGHALGRFITHYRNTYFIPDFNGYNWIPQHDAMRRITERIAPLVLRMRATDYLELPKLLNQFHWLELEPAVRQKYREVENEFFTELGEDVVIAPSAAAAGVKCRQILNGAVYVDGKDYVVLHDQKLDALEELTEELSGQPLLILYEFQHDRERIVERLGWPAIGQQSAKKDADLIQMFNAGLLPGLIGHPASMGHGLNLQGACSHVAWFGLTWNLEYYDQAVARVWRQGNEASHVIVHHFCIRNSLDESVVRTLEGKAHTQTTFMETIRHLRSL